MQAGCRPLCRAPSPPQPLSPPRSSQALANSPWEPLLRGRLHTTLRLRDRCWRTRPTTPKGSTSTSLPFISDVESGGHYEPHGVNRKYSHDTVYQGRGGTPVQESSYHSGGSGAFLKERKKERKKPASIPVTYMDLSCGVAAFVSIPMSEAGQDLDSMIFNIRHV